VECSLCDGSAIIVASKLTLASNPTSAILTPDRQLPEASLASPRLPRTFAILTEPLLFRTLPPLADCATPSASLS
jgi:hypothetical protein